jgi:hypothetical protein
MVDYGIQHVAYGVCQAWLAIGDLLGVVYGESGLFRCRHPPIPFQRKFFFKLAAKAMSGEIVLWLKAYPAAIGAHRRCNDMDMCMTGVHMPVHDIGLIFETHAGHETIRDADQFIGLELFGLSEIERKMDAIVMQPFIKGRSLAKPVQNFLFCQPIMSL